MSPGPVARQAAVTLRDLARRAGVDPSTVSRVLNRDPRVRISDGTRARVLDAAAATGYRPNRVARSLKLRCTRIIGMLIPDVTNPLFSALFRAVDDAAGAAGYHVILCNTDDRARRLEEHLDALGEGHVDGLLIATARRNDPVVGTLRRRGLPYVLVNRHRDDPADVSVVPDDRQAAHLAVMHLLSLGHRRIAHLGGSAEVSRSASRLGGFREAMAAAGYPAGACLPATAGLDETAGARGLARLLALPAAERPTAVYAGNDLAALGVIAAARQAGLQVPEDLSVVGGDDVPAGRYAAPALTTIRVPIQEMGRLATDLLLRQMKGGGPPDEPPAQRVLPVTLVVRGSTAPPPVKESAGDARRD